MTTLWGCSPELALTFYKSATSPRIYFTASTSVNLLILIALPATLYCFRTRSVLETNVLLVFLAMAMIFVCSYAQHAPPGPVAPQTQTQTAPPAAREPELPEQQGDAIITTMMDSRPVRPSPVLSSAARAKAQASLYKQSQLQAMAMTRSEVCNRPTGPAVDDYVGRIRASHSSGLPGECWQIFKEALAAGVALDERFFAVAVESLDEVTLRQGGAEQVLQSMCRLELVPDYATQNRLASAFKRQLPQNIAEAFWTLRAEGGAPLGRVACGSLMAAFERAEPERTLELYQEMLAAGVTLNRVACNAVLCALGQLGMSEQALGLLSHMSALGETDPTMVPNGKSYGSVIHSCAASKKYLLAISLFDHMVQCGIEPNRFAYNDAITSCVRLKKVNKAMVLYERMKTSGVPPCDSTHRLLIRTCHLRGLHAEEAYFEEQLQLVKMAEVAAQFEDASVYRESSVDGNSE